MTFCGSGLGEIKIIVDLINVRILQNYYVVIRGISSDTRVDDEKNGMGMSNHNYHVKLLKFQKHYTWEINSLKTRKANTSLANKLFFPGMILMSSYKSIMMIIF